MSSIMKRLDLRYCHRSKTREVQSFISFTIFVLVFASSVSEPIAFSGNLDYISSAQIPTEEGQVAV